MSLLIKKITTEIRKKKDESISHLMEIFINNNKNLEDDGSQ